MRPVLEASWMFSGGSLESSGTSGNGGALITFLALKVCNTLVTREMNFFRGFSTCSFLRFFNANIHCLGKNLAFCWTTVMLSGSSVQKS